MIYWVAALLYLLFDFSAASAWFFAGITLIAGVSFWDDVQPLGQKVRLLFHLMAMSCAFWLTGFFGAYPWWAVAIGYVVFIGIVNAYNFMDGINGITGLYSIAVLASLQYVNMTGAGFVNPDFIWYPMIASALIVTLFPAMGGSIFVILLVMLVVIYLLKFKWMRRVTPC